MAGFSWPCGCCDNLTNMRVAGHRRCEVTDIDGNVTVGNVSRFDPGTLEVLWTFDLDRNGEIESDYNYTYRRCPIRVLICSDGSVLVAWVPVISANQENSDYNPYTYRSYVCRKTVGGVAKLDADGELLWEIEYGPDWQTENDPDTSYRYPRNPSALLRMEFAGGSSPEDSFWISGGIQADRDALMLKYDSDGNELECWSFDDFQFTYSPTHSDYAKYALTCSGMAVDKDSGDLWLSFNGYGYNFMATKMSQNKTILAGDWRTQYWSDQLSQGIFSQYDQFGLTNAGKFVNTCENEWVRRSNGPLNNYDPLTEGFPFQAVSNGQLRNYRACQKYPLLQFSDDGMPHDGGYVLNPEFVVDPDEDQMTWEEKQADWWLRPDGVTKYIRDDNWVWFPKPVMLAMSSADKEYIADAMSDSNFNYRWSGYGSNSYFTFRYMKMQRSTAFILDRRGARLARSQRAISSEGFVIPYIQYENPLVPENERVNEYIVSRCNDVSGTFFAGGVTVAANINEIAGTQPPEYTLSIWEPGNYAQNAVLTHGSNAISKEVYCLSDLHWSIENE